MNILLNITEYFADLLNSFNFAVEFSIKFYHYLPDNSMNHENISPLKMSENNFQSLLIKLTYV